VSDNKAEDKDEKLDKSGGQKTAAELLTEQIKTVLGSLKKIEIGPKWRLFFCIKERRRFLKKLKIAKRKLSEELNLQKVIQSQRMATCAILSLLTGPQNFFCEKMARLKSRLLLKKPKDIPFAINRKRLTTGTQRCLFG